MDAADRHSRSMLTRLYFVDDSDDSTERGRTMSWWPMCVSEGHLAAVTTPLEASKTISSFPPDRPDVDSKTPTYFLTFKRPST